MLQDIRDNTAQMHAKFQGVPQLVQLLEAYRLRNRALASCLPDCSWD